MKFLPVNLKWCKGETLKDKNIEKSLSCCMLDGSAILSTKLDIHYSVQI